MKATKPPKRSEGGQHRLGRAVRGGSDFPEFLEPRRAAEKALTAVIQEAYVQEASTRD